MEISATAHKNVASAIVDNGERNGYNKNRQKDLLYTIFFVRFVGARKTIK